MKKLLFSFLCVFALESNLSAQQIDATNASIYSIESNKEWVFIRNKMVYNVGVPFFTRANPLAESYPLLYGMSIYTLYEASETDLVATIDLLKIDVQALVASNDGVASKKPHAIIKALNDEESWNTTFKRDGSEIQQTQRTFDFDTEAQAQKFIAELKICVKVSQIFSVEAEELKQQSGANADANTLENSKKRIKLLEQAEALIAGKKYTQLEIILASEKYEQYEKNISNLVEYNIKVERYVPAKNAPQDAPTQIYNNLAKLNAIRKTFQEKYKTFEENYYPSVDKRNWGITKRLNSVNARGGFATSFPATLAEYQAFVVKVQVDKQEESKNLENANAIDASGNSALMNAIKAKDLEKVKSLIKAGAVVTYENPKTNTSILKCAIDAGDADILKTLLYVPSMGTYNVANPLNFEKEFAYAVEKGDLVGMYAIAVIGNRKYNIANSKGYFPAMIAYQAGNLEVCKDLLSRYHDAPYFDAYEQQSTSDKMTLLMMAAAKNDVNTIKTLFLLERDKKPETMNKDGYTAMMLAAENGSKEVIELAISKGYKGIWKFKSTEGKMKGKTALDVAKDSEIKKIIKNAIK